MSIGIRIKTERERQGISQTDMAKRIKASKQTLYKYENNIITNIPSDKIEAIADVLNVSPGYLMGWENFTEQAAIVDADLLCLTPKQKNYIIRISKLSEDKQEAIFNIVDQLLIVKSETEVEEWKTNLWFCYV